MEWESLSERRCLLKTPLDTHYGQDGYFGLMFDIACAGEAAIHAIHATTYNAAYVSESTVYTVMGGFSANKDHQSRWTKQCHGPVGHIPSRLEFASPVALRRGDILGVYVASSNVFCTGVAPARSEATYDDVIAILPGMILNRKAQFHGFQDGLFDFVGGVEYHVGFLSEFPAMPFAADSADVTLMLGAACLPAHSTVLAGSSVLQDLIETQASSEIHIGDIDEATVREMLRFLYSGTADAAVLADDIACLSLLKAAHRFNLPVLLETCITALSQRMQMESISELLLVADDVCCHPLKRKSVGLGSYGAISGDIGFVQVPKRHRIGSEFFMSSACNEDACLT